MANQLIKSRSKAYLEQQGLCIYCEAPMWLTTPSFLVSKYRLTSRQARFFKCTAEHLQAKKDGGTNRQQNIAAACFFCNSLRHHKKSPLDPLSYKSYVAERLKKNAWNFPLMQR